MGLLSRRAIAACPISEKRLASIGSIMLIALMSAPAIKARSPGPRHDDRPRRLGLQLQKRLPDLLDHLPIKSVQLLLTVDGKDGDAALTLYTSHSPRRTPFGRQAIRFQACQAIS